MEVIEHGSAAAFLEATVDYRAQEPLRTNLMGSMAAGVAQGRPAEAAQWLTVREAGAVVGAATRTAPFNLVLGPMSEEAASAVGRHCAASAQDLPGVGGPEAAVRAAILQLGRPFRLYLREVLRVLTVLTPPASMPEGRTRPAEPRDVELLSRWHRAFLEEVGLPAPDGELGVPRMGPGGGALWVWEVADRPVAMAGHAPVVATPGDVIGRVGPVYTAPDHRRLGIGAALTAAVTRELLASCDRVMLFADAENATANGVYQRLGFTAAGEQVEAALL